MDHPPNLFPLKMVVIFLSFLLLGAIVFVLAVVIPGLRGSEAKPCPDVGVHLPEPGTVTAVNRSGPNMLVTLQSKGATTVLTYDSCSGALLHRFTVAP